LFWIQVLPPFFTHEQADYSIFFPTKCIISEKVVHLPQNARYKTDENRLLTLAVTQNICIFVPEIINIKKED